MEHKPFVFFGTPYVGRDTLIRLMEAGYVPALVVTAPDAPRGRGMVLTPCETKAWAREKGLRVFSPEKLDAEAVKEIRAAAGEYAIVVAYGKFLPESLIRAFPHGAVNVHYSLLPKYRGASPVEAALLHDEQVTGVTVQKMVKEMDAGDVLGKASANIFPDDTTMTLRARLISLGAALLIGLLPKIETGDALGTPQEHDQATFATKIDKSEGELDLSGDAKENWNKYRAYAENPGTYFFMEKNGKRMRIKIKSAKFENGAFIPDRIVPEGKKETSFSEFSN